MTPEETDLIGELKIAYDENNIPYMVEATGEEAIKVVEALERQIPKKPLPDRTDFPEELCSMCGTKYFLEKIKNQCANCRQRLKCEGG